MSCRGRASTTWRRICSAAISARTLSTSARASTRTCTTSPCIFSRSFSRSRHFAALRLGSATASATADLVVACVSSELCSRRAFIFSRSSCATVFSFSSSRSAFVFSFSASSALAWRCAAAAAAAAASAVATAVASLCCSAKTFKYESASVTRIQLPVGRLTTAPSPKAAKIAFLHTLSGMRVAAASSATYSSNGRRCCDCRFACHRVAMSAASASVGSRLGDMTEVADVGYETTYLDAGRRPASR